MLHEVFLLVFPVFMKFEHECIFVYVHCSMYQPLSYSILQLSGINMHRVSDFNELDIQLHSSVISCTWSIFSAENMDESFDIGDAERMLIEEIAQVANLDAITLCSCRGMCLRKKGRNACPCETIGQYCSSACHDLSSACMN